MRMADPASTSMSIPMFVCARMDTTETLVNTVRNLTGVFHQAQSDIFSNCSYDLQKRFIFQLQRKRAAVHPATMAAPASTLMSIPSSVCAETVTLDRLASEVS